MQRDSSNHRRIRLTPVIVAVALLGSLFVFAAPSSAESPTRPVGYVDVARLVDGGIEVAGWTYDADASGSSNWVHVYVDGVFVAELGANRGRADVNAAFGIAGRHGFGGVVAGGPGDEVCVFGLGVDGAGRYDGGNALLSRGCTVMSGTSTGPAPTPAPAPAPPPPSPTTPPPVAAAAPPIGFVDSIASNLIGGLRVAGWAYDPDRPLASIEVSIYLDGDLAGTDTTDRQRADVNAAVGINGAHGFSYDLALDLGAHTICVEATGVNGSNSPDGVDGPLPVLYSSGETAQCHNVIFYPPACEKFVDDGDAALLACIEDL